MNEPQDTPEPRKPQESHWDSLANDLGADTSQSVELERQATNEPAASKREAKPAAKREPKPAPKNHWQSLAGWLGISSAEKKAEPEPEPEPEPVAEQPEAPPEPVPASPPTPPPANPAPASTFGANIFDTPPAAADDTAPAPAGTDADKPLIDGFTPSAPDDVDAPQSQEAWEKLGFEFKSKPEPREARSGDYGEMTFEGADEETFADTYWDADSPSDVISNDESRETTAPERDRGARRDRDERSESEGGEEGRSRRGRRSRRGGRRRGGRGGERREETSEARSEPRRAPREEVAESTTESDAKPKWDSSETEEERPRGRRRGSRGGRRRNRDQQEDQPRAAARERDPLDDVERRLEQSADLFDELPDDIDEVDSTVAEETPAEVSGYAIAEDADADAEGDGDETSREGGRPPHRRIPSWDEAVGVIVDSNIAHRGKREHGGGSSRRGGRRGGRRRSSR